MYEISGEELLGDYLLQGEDEMLELMGQNPRARPSRQAVANARASKGVIVSQRAPRDARHLPLGLDSGTVAIAAGASTTINVVPQKPFRTERLVVDPTSAGAFLINDVKVGTDSQFVTAGAVPASIFLPNSVGVGLKGDTANLGITISVLLTNYSAAAARFLGALLGTAVGY